MEKRELTEDEKKKKTEGVEEFCMSLQRLFFNRKNKLMTKEQSDKEFIEYMKNVSATIRTYRSVLIDLMFEMEHEDGYHEGVETEREYGEHPEPIVDESRD